MAILDDVQATPAITHKDMPYVRFESKTVEDRAESKKQQRMVFKEKHFAVITPPGSKDTQYEEVPHWWDKLEFEYKAGRVLPDWIARWKRDFELYQKGQEIPVDGTPIRGWKLLSGSQQENLIRMNILTVEALANINSEAATNIGMGANELKRRAQAWLDQGAKEPAALKMLELTRDNASLKGQVETLLAKVEQLEQALSKRK